MLTAGGHVAYRKLSSLESSFDRFYLTEWLWCFTEVREAFGTEASK